MPAISSSPFPFGREPRRAEAVQQSLEQPEERDRRRLTDSADTVRFTIYRAEAVGKASGRRIANPLRERKPGRRTGCRGISLPEVSSERLQDGVKGAETADQPRGQATTASWSISTQDQERP